MKADLALEVERLQAAHQNKRELVLAKLARKHDIAMEKLKIEWVRKLQLKQTRRCWHPRAASACSREHKPRRSRERCSAAASPEMPGL